MSGIDFDRQQFVAPSDPAPQQPSRIVGLVILLIALAGIGYVSYKLVSGTNPSSASTESDNLQQIQQQLADIKQGIDELETRRRVVASEPAVALPKAGPTVASTEARAKPAYQISAASALDPQRIPKVVVPTPVPRPSAASSESDATNREVWQATTNRLADVAGVVGSQQGEIAQTREELNQLLAQTRRTALQFELTRGTERQSVGPLELQLKTPIPSDSATAFAYTFRTNALS